jgi:hypothetical protein
MNYNVSLKKSIDHGLASAAFLLLFPGFFFYHFAIARGYISPFLGGYFGIVAVLSFFPLAFTYLKNKSLDLNNKLLIFLLINVYTVIIVVYNFILSMPNGYSNDMALWSMSGVLFNLVAFLIGRQINFLKVLNINFFALILMLSVVILNVGEQGIFYVKIDAVDESVVATYQGFARSLVFVSLILTGGFIGNPKRNGIIFIMCFLALFLNGSRTEFALYIVSSLIVYFLYIFKSLKGVILFIMVMLFLTILTSYLIDTYPESRMLQLFFLQESTSFQARSELNAYGWSLVSDSPLMGNYGMYVNLGGVGNYPHNLFSAWVNLGVVGILLYFSLFFLLVKSAFLGFRGNYNNLTYRIFLIFTLFAVASVIFSKDYSDMVIGFLVGIFCNWRDSKNI